VDNTGFTLKNNVYNGLKWVALVLLPLLATLYFGLGQIWNFPAIEKVIGSIAVLDTALGFLLSKSSSNYQTYARGIMGEEPVGELIVRQDIDGTPMGMRAVAYRDPFIVEDQNKAVFNVRREQDVS
jgi:hypothetical protein